RTGQYQCAFGVVCVACIYVADGLMALLCDSATAARRCNRRDGQYVLGNGGFYCGHLRDTLGTETHYRSIDLHLRHPCRWRGDWGQCRFSQPTTIMDHRIDQWRGIRILFPLPRRLVDEENR